MTVDARRSRLRTWGPGLLMVLVLPLVVFRLVRTQFGNDTMALAVAGSIPVAWVFIQLAWRRRAEPLGVLVASGFVVAILVSFFTGGSALPLKLADPTVTGLLGLICLVSIAVRRPLLAVVFQLMGRGRGPGGALQPVRHRGVSVATAIIGVTLLVHAAAHTIVALTLPTRTYVIVARLVGIPIYVAGGLLFLAYVRRQRRRGDFSGS